MRKFDAVHWSLVSNARQHAKVKAALEKEAVKSATLKKILAEVNAKSQASAS